MKLLHNARIYTLESARPVASALVIDAGRLVAVGGEELLAEYGYAERQDMGGRVILPGLTDAHIHLQEYARSLQAVDCEGQSRQEILHRLAGRLGEMPPGEWLRGHGWNQNDWGGEWPGAADLDAVAPHNPVYLTAKSLHAAWVNSCRPPAGRDYRLHSRSGQWPHPARCAGSTHWHPVRRCAQTG